MFRYVEIFKKWIRFIVSIVISREFAFIYCIMGTIAQVSHTYFLLNSISSLEGVFKIVQAIILSVFISSSLLYFVAIADKSDKTQDYEKIEISIITFTIIEIIINVYYYTRHLWLDVAEKGLEPKYFDFVFALIISFLIPITIKMYSSHIRAKQWLTELSDNEKTTNEQVPPPVIIKEADGQQIKVVVDQVVTSAKDKLHKEVDTYVSEITEKIDKSVIDSFKNNQDKFIHQFQNKLNYMQQQQQQAKIQNTEL